MILKYVDGPNIYQTEIDDPIGRVDYNGTRTSGVRATCKPCDSSPSFKGHGVPPAGDNNDSAPSAWDAHWKKRFEKEGIVPFVMTNGLDGDYLEPRDIAAACDKYCEGATLNLTACNIGLNEDYMRSLGAACSKIKKVCGTTVVVLAIPHTTWTIPVFPWHWKCVDVN